MRTRLAFDSLWQMIVIVVCIGVFARLAFFVYFLIHAGEAGLLFGDSLHYLALADSTLSGHGYMYDGALESFRAPGYPAYFMLFRLLHAPLWSASLLQSMVSAGIAGWVVWFTRTKLKLSARAAFIAGLVAALEPDQVYYSAILLPDVFFTIGTLAAFTYVLRWFERGQLRYLAYAGVAIGIANYFRPALLYLPFFLAVLFFVWAWWNRVGMKRPAVASIIVIVAAFGVMAPWYVRNEYTFGAFGFISSEAYGVYVYDAVATTAALQHRTYEDVKEQMLAQALVAAPDPNLDSFADKQYLTGLAWTAIAPHPEQFLEVYLLGLNEFWTSGNYQYLFKSMGLLAPPSQAVSYAMLIASQGIHAAVSSFAQKITEPFILVALFDRVFWFCVFLLSLGGIALYRRDPAGWLMALLVVYFSATILSVTIGVEARHRYALDPLMFAFTVAAIYWIYEKYRGRRARISAL